MRSCSAFFFNMIEFTCSKLILVISVTYNDQKWIWCTMRAVVWVIVKPTCRFVPKRNAFTFLWKPLLLAPDVGFFSQQNKQWRNECNLGECVTMKAGCSSVPWESPTLSRLKTRQSYSQEELKGTILARDARNVSIVALFCSIKLIPTVLWIWKVEFYTSLVSPFVETLRVVKQKANNLT